MIEFIAMDVCTKQELVVRDIEVASLSELAARLSSVADELVDLLSVATGS
jgi:hypothetical protein